MHKKTSGNHATWSSQIWIFVMKRHPRIRSRVGQSRVHQKRKQSRSVAILVFTVWRKIVGDAFNAWINRNLEDVEYGNKVALYASGANYTSRKVSIACLDTK